MTGIRVFVSHSFGQDHTILDGIQALLGAEFNLYIDKDQNLPGWEWRLKVHAALAECDAAIILFNNRGMQQPNWVLKEATILLWRLAVDPDFVILPVRLPEVDNATFGASPFEPLKLKDLILLKSADPAEIAVAARERFKGMTRSVTPRDRIRLAIADSLREVADGTLLTAGQDVLGGVKWVAGSDRRETFAALLAEHILKVQGEACLGTTRALLTAVKPGIKQQTGRQILNVAGPLWVEADAAGGIHSSNCIAINGLRLADFTARQYIDRAFPFGRLAHIAQVDGRPDEDAPQHYKDKIRKWIRSAEPSIRTDADADTYLQDILAADLFVLFPDFPDDELLAALRHWLPQATFLICTGESLPKAPRPPNVRYLEPELDLKLETKAHLTHIWLDSFVRSLP